MRTFIITIVFSIGMIHCLAQDKRTIDSLLSILESPIADSTRVNILLEGLAMEYYLSDPLLAMKYCEEARQISERTNFKVGQSSAYGWLAYLYEQQGEISKAIEFNQRSLKLLRELGNKKQVATVLNNLGAIYKDRGNIDEALKYYQESLTIRSAIGDSAGLATVYNNLGIIHSNQGNIEQALSYYYRSLKIEEALGNKDGISTSLQNIGLVYKEQGDLAEAMKIYKRASHLNVMNNDKYSMGYSMNGIGGIYELRDSLDQALEYYNKAYEIRKELNDKQGMAYSLKNIGGIYEKLDREGYMEHYTRSLSIFTEIDDKWGMTSVMIKLGEHYLKQGDMKRAEELASTAFDLARKLGYPSEIRDAAHLMNRILSRRGQWEEAFKMNELYYQMRDSVTNVNNRKETFRQQFRHEFEKKEAAILADQDKKNALATAELKRQKTEKYAYLGGFALILVFSILLFNRFRIIQRQKRIIEEARDQVSTTLEQLKNTQQQLIESEKLAAFGVMASRMAHEIQNPLNFVNNFSEMSEDLVRELSDSTTTEEKEETMKTLTENLQKINEHGKRAESIVRSLQEHIKAGTAHVFFEK